jgi:taurine--2-oxoglutarate transaminase
MQPSAQATMTGDEIVALCKQHTLFEWSAQANVDPIPVVRAKGVYFWDADGKRYLDFNSQLMCVNIGHGDERIIRAIQEQAAELCYVHPAMATEPRARLGAMLARIAPGDLNHAFFTTGGAESVEHAVRMARAFTGRQKIVTRYRSYHGATAGAASLTGEPRRWPTEPGLPGVVRVLDPHRYRCSFCTQLPACTLDCLNHVEEVMHYEGPNTIAAVLIESVVGTNGIIIPPDGYMQGLRALCDRYGILLICDEVMSGFGRTGEWFAVNHWNIVPDIMTVAKGLTSAYLPLGAVLVNDAIAEHYQTNMLASGLTYGAHPLSCAAAIAAIKVYEEDGLIENARRMGRVLGQELEGLKQRHPSVGDVRYIGLFSIIELVKDRATREPLVPFNPAPSQMGPMVKLTEYLLDNGLFAFRRWNTLFCNPPLCITEHQLREGIEIIDKALDITDAEVGG